MFFLYMTALCALGAVLLGVLVDAVKGISNKPAWTKPRRKLEVVYTVDRRTQDLPFVGNDRRVVTRSAPLDDGLEREAA